MTGQRVKIIQLPAAAIDALAATDLTRAIAISGLALTADFIAPAQLSTWRMRSEQLRRAPDDAGWVTGVVWDLDADRAVGRAGFHGPPDESGMVEIGYSIDPALRRRGYARAALAYLIDRAEHDPGVRTVRASISPDNRPSLNLVRQFGFIEVGDQWDEEDGLEIVYEVSVPRVPDPGPA